MQRLKTVVAVALALVWLPAVSCCLVDASGLFSKKDCCSKKHSHQVPVKGDCDKPCGVLASGSYFPKENQALIIAPIGVPLFDGLELVRLDQRPLHIDRDWPATAPPELAGQWRFSYRAALPPRAPSLAS